jgi:signal transduction histidine kinase
MVSGSPDLAAQLLDKLVANAVDFSRAGAPVRVSLAPADGAAALAVRNQGPPLPESLGGKLFDSMVSVRADRGGVEPHLGLGLYVARLIAEFHGGAIGAENLAPGGGVAVTATFRLA